MTRPLASLSLATLLLASCATRVPPSAVAWNESVPPLGPPGATRADEAEGTGYLRVETDTDLRVNGSLGYDNVRRPYDLYSAEGALIRADVDNQGGRYGEEPVRLALPAGRYVVASVYGATYRKVQVDIVRGEITDVPATVLREAPAVFAR